jgi:hypothetical protein
MKIEDCSGWILILGSMLLLVALGKIGLLVVLVPMSLLLAFAIVACLARNESKLSDGVKKG